MEGSLEQTHISNRETAFNRLMGTCYLNDIYLHLLAIRLECNFTTPQILLYQQKKDIQFGFIV